MKDKKNPYVRHSTVEISVVLAAIRAGLRVDPSPNAKIKADINGQQVGVSSLRLRTFEQKGTVCKCCGLEATHFAVERNHADERNGNPYHINLYGVRDGGEVLFTHDHTIARSLGGRDSIDNTETMCLPCNSEKSLHEQALARELKNKK